MVRPEIIERRKEIAKTPLLDRIAAMREMLAAAGDEAQQLRHLPAWASKAMADQRFYRYALPLELGGENLRAREHIEIIEDTPQSFHPRERCGRRAIRRSRCRAIR